MWSYWVPVSALSQGSKQDFYSKGKLTGERGLRGGINWLTQACSSYKFFYSLCEEEEKGHFPQSFQFIQAYKQVSNSIGSNIVSNMHFLESQI